MGSTHSFTRNVSDFAELYGNGINLFGIDGYSGTNYWYPLVTDVGPGGLFTDVQRVSSSAGGFLNVYGRVENWGTSDREVVYAFNVSQRAGVAYLGTGRIVEYSTDTIALCLRVTLGAAPENDVIRLVEMFYSHTWTELGTDYSFAFDISKWYSIRIQMASTAIKARIWELDTAEPESWQLEVTGNAGQYNTYFCLGTSGAQQLDIAYFGVTDNPSTYPLAAPSSVSSERTGDGAIEYAEYGYLNQIDRSVFVEGGGGGAGSVQFEDATIIGATGAIAVMDFEDSSVVCYGNFLGAVAFPEAVIASYVLSGGTAAIDFPEFGIHQTLNAYGEVEWDISDTFNYTGKSGAKGATLFSTAVILATGKHLVSGDSAVAFGSFTLDGHGNFSGEIDSSEFVVDASGFVLPVGNAALSHSFKIAATGTIGSVSTGECGVVFSSFQVSGSSGSHIHGAGVITFPLITLAGGSTRPARGNAEITFPLFTISGTGSHKPHGHGAIEFDLDILAYGSNDQCYHKLLEYVR